MKQKLYTITKNKMKEKEKLLQKVDRRVEKTPTEPIGTSGLLKSLAACIAVLFAKNGLGQEVKVYDPQLPSKEVGYQSLADVPDSTVIWSDTLESPSVKPDSV